MYAHGVHAKEKINFQNKWLCVPGSYGPKLVLEEIGMISSALLGAGEKIK